MLSKIRFCKLDARAKTPVRKNSTDGGLDLFSLEDHEIQAGFSELVRTGISLEVPEGFVVKLWAKGRSDFLIGSGVVDAHYEPGEIIVRIINPHGFGIRIKAGDAVCQAVYIPVETPEIEEVFYKELESKAERSGSGKIAEMTAQITSLSKEYNYND